MKKIVLMVAVVACVAFASQGVQASTVQVSVENVMQDDFVKIEVKELPQAVQDAIAKSYEGSTVKEAYVAGADGAGQCGGNRLQRGDFTLTGGRFLKDLTERVFHGIAETPELYAAGADGVVQTADEYTRQENVDPSHSVQCACDKVVKCLHSLVSFPFLFFSLKMILRPVRKLRQSVTRT